jgi:Uma2 family endonuclease
VVLAAPEPPVNSQPAIGEQRVVMHNVSWESYLQILHALPQNRGARLTYDDGILEITMPLEEHETSGRLIERFISILVEELGMEMKTMGSTTMNYPHLRKGAEPDNAYYIQNQPLVKDRNVDFAQDPPPDLVVEVDITHTDIRKNAFYASIGVPEFWRFNGKIWRIYQLRAGVYEEVETSPTFPQIPKNSLYRFLELAKQGEVAAMKALRTWL